MYVCKDSAAPAHAPCDHKRSDLKFDFDFSCCAPPLHIRSPPIPLVDHTQTRATYSGGLCGENACLGRTSRVGCGVCDTPKLWLVWRRGPVSCVRVYARVLVRAAESSFTYRCITCYMTCTCDL